jgi:hypothetical protein
MITALYDDFLMIFVFFDRFCGSIMMSIMKMVSVLPTPSLSPRQLKLAGISNKVFPLQATNLVKIASTLLS